MNSVLELLEQTAAQSGNPAAVSDANGTCSYRELLRHSQCVGSGLLAHVMPRRPVPVLMEKSILTLSVFFGAVQAGCFYVLLNPELPKSRLTQIITVLSPDVLVTDEEHRSLAQEIFSDGQILSASDLCGHAVDEAGLFARRAQALDTDPLYANFTSGSTGTPKGVLVGHRSVLDFIGQFTRLFDITQEDVIANQAPFDFDVSVKDIYSAVSTGASLVIVPKRLFSLPAELLDFLCDHHATTLIWAVSALCLVSTFHGLDYRVPAEVRKVLFSGEVMPNKHLNSWMEHLPEATFVNLYGPTEITCNCTYHVIDRARDYSGGIPIGRPFPNEQVFLLSGENTLITQAETEGEICVCGTALALGYYNAPEQTAAAFVQNPLNTCYPERIYRTGDLGRYNENGELVFSGRKDFQIKYMGHRIELEEIERAMSAVPGIERVCCIFDAQKSRLTGFYVGTASRAELHSALTASLPVYMIPTVLTQLDEMPMTKNGKIDRKDLAARKRAKRHDK